MLIVRIKNYIFKDPRSIMADRVTLGGLRTCRRARKGLRRAGNVFRSIRHRRGHKSGHLRNVRGYRPGNRQEVR